MRTIICLFLQCTCLCYALAQTTENTAKKQPWILHSVAFSANISPRFPEIPSRYIPTELPIGRFQPSISLCRDDSDKWLEISLLVLRPGLSKSVIDTFTVVSTVPGLPLLQGHAGKFDIFHTAFGVSRGKLMLSEVFGLNTTMDYGVLIGYEKTKYTNNASILPGRLDYKANNLYAGINFALGLRLLSKSKFSLDLKIQNYYTFGIERRFLSDGSLFSTILNVDGSFFVPMVQARCRL